MSLHTALINELGQSSFVNFLHLFSYIVLLHSVVGYMRPDQSVNRVYTPVLLAVLGALSSFMSPGLSTN